MRIVVYSSLLFAISCAGAFAAEPQAGQIVDPLRALEQVGLDGAGHLAAQAAWKKLAALDAANLPALLVALDDAGPLAANWLRSAIESIAAREQKAGHPLPVPAIEEFLRDRTHAPRARRLAFELLAKFDPTAPDRWIPQMLDDPSVELRRDAVARVLDQAAALAAKMQTDAAVKAFRQALGAARDLDQLQLAVDELKKLGVEIDLPKQLGLITAWKVVGPFDNTGGKGYARVYPPEEGVDLAKTYMGKAGEVRWQDATSTDPFGHVDLNRALGKEKGVVGYAYAVFTSAKRHPVELRLGSDNAFQLWLNGKRINDAEIYHSFTSLDQYIARGMLEPGENQILVKLCQNEQTEEWAGDWKFQLRVCDATGGAILSEDRK